MPATNPRLTITLKPSTATLLRRISELTGNSQSSLIAELLESSEPMFERLVTLLQAATEAKASITADMVAGLEEAQTKLEGQLGLTFDTWDAAAKPLLEHAEKVTRRARAAGGPRAAGGSGGAVPTPPSNRGVRSTPKTTKKSTRTRG